MNPVITTNELTMRFRGCDALLGVNVAIQPGTVFALLGENGAGKTTMIRIMTGFQSPTSGSCRVCGLDPTKHPLDVRRRVGYVSDAPAMYDWMSVGEIGWFAATFYDPPFLDRYRESIRRYELPENRKLKLLSKGQRAKVALSLALAHDPELLILDEPTSGLDPMVRREFLESMIDRAATGRTVFLSSHQISEVERVADTIGILHEGKLKICCPLTELKDSVIEITVSVADPLATLPTLPEPAEILSEQTDGHQRRIVARYYDGPMHDLLATDEGVVSVRERSLSLEEIFVASTKGVTGLSSYQPSANEPLAASEEVSS